MIGSPLNKRLEYLIKGSKLCRKFTDYICLDEKRNEINIFMGIGFISGRDGLSQGLPIDILNMIIVADEVREKLSPVKSKIHLLIADHMAYQHLDGDTLLHAKKVAKVCQDHIIALLQNLDLQDKVNIHLSSQVIEDERFQAILKSLHEQDIGRLPKSEDNLALDILTCQSGYTESHRFYFVNQTALGKFFKEVYQCQIKLGWSKGSAHKVISCSEHYDEPHFDRFYRQIYGHDLSFIYVDSGHNLANDASEVPYSAPNKGRQHARLLFGQKVSSLTINPKLALVRNIHIYYEYLTRNSTAKDCSMEEKLSVIQELAQERPKESLAILQEAFETLHIGADSLDISATLTPGYTAFRSDIALPGRGLIHAIKKEKKSRASVLL